VRRDVRSRTDAGRRLVPSPGPCRQAGELRIGRPQHATVPGGRTRGNARRTGQKESWMWGTGHDLSIGQDLPELQIRA